MNKEKKQLRQDISAAVEDVLKKFGKKPSRKVSDTIKDAAKSISKKFLKELPKNGSNGVKKKSETKKPLIREKGLSPLTKKRSAAARKPASHTRKRQASSSKKSS